MPTIEKKDLIQQSTAYIISNPKSILLLLVVLIIVIIWLTYNSKVNVSNFSSDKEKLVDKKTGDKKYKKKTLEKNEDINDIKSSPVIEKPVVDPVVAKLVNEINENS